MSRTIYSAIVACAAIFGLVGNAFAASLYFSPSSGSYAVGDTVSVSAYVSSSDQAINAYDGIISYPSDKLEVASISGDGISSLWVEAPSYSNAAGTASFSGIVFNPGYTGTSGRLLTVQFRAKASGSATVRYNSGSVLANDGQGTDVLTGLGTATFTIGGEEEPPAPTPEEEPTTSTTGKVPSAPAVSSDTHPDETAWYASDAPSFRWSLPAGVTDVNVLADHQPNTDPGTRSDGLRSSYTYTDVDDGIWYFHIRLKNAAGWGAVSHRQFNVDTTPPSRVVVTETERVAETDPALFSVDAEDGLSGILGYEVSVDDGPFSAWLPREDGTYAIEGLSAGDHAVAVKAFDRAGNFLESESVAFLVPVQNVVPEVVPPPVIEAPAATGVDVIGWLRIVGLCLFALFLIVVFVRIVIHLASYEIVVRRREHNPFSRSDRAVRRAGMALRADLRRKERRMDAKLSSRTVDADLTRSLRLFEEALAEIRKERASPSARRRSTTKSPSQQP